MDTSETTERVAPDGEIEAAFCQQVGKKLEYYRTARGLSQCTLAAEVGVHRNTISRWESGDQAIPTWMLMRCADILACHFLLLLPSKDYIWGRYRDYLAERDRGKGVQTERDPNIDKEIAGLSATVRKLRRRA